MRCDKVNRVHCYHIVQVAHIEVEKCCRCKIEREIQDLAYMSFKGGAEYNLYLDNTNQRN
jgi:hypothetical protein